MAQKRRPRGDGSIYQTVNGSGETVWMAAMTLGGTRYRRTGKTEAEVARKRRQLVADFEAGRLKKPAGQTVGDALRLWVTEGLEQEISKGEKRSTSTQANHVWAAERLLEAECHPPKGSTQPVVFLRDIPVADLTPGRVTQALTWVRDRPKPKTAGGKPPRDLVSRDTLARLKTILRQAVSYAINTWDLVAANPVREALIPTGAAQNGTKGAIPLEDLLRLLPVLAADPDGAGFYLMVRCGLSYQEAFGLAVDGFDGSSVSVFQAVKRERGATKKPRLDGQKHGHTLEVSTKLKNPYRRRNIMCQSDVIEVLGRHLGREASRIKAARKAGGRPLMFARPDGSPIDNKLANKRLRAFCEPLGIQAVLEDDTGEKTYGTVTTHVLRHTQITELVNRKAFELDVVDMAGHKDTRMLHSRYRNRDSRAPRTAGIVHDYLSNG